MVGRHADHPLQHVIVLRIGVTRDEVRRLLEVDRGQEIVLFVDDVLIGQFQ